MKKRLVFLVSTFLIVGLTFAMNSRREASATVPGINQLISVNDTGDGHPGSSGASGSVVSADGYSVAFVSASTDLVAGDTNGKNDVFVRNLLTNTTTRVDVSSSGVQANSYPVGSVGISRTGRYVVFTSWATNLIDGQTTRLGEVYIHDMATGTTSLVTKTATGTPATCGSTATAVSSDGRFVMFIGDCNDLGLSHPSGNYVNIIDRQTGTLQIAGLPLDGTSGSVGNASMNCDGTIVAFDTSYQVTSDDLDTRPDVYLADFRDGLKITEISALTTSASKDAYRPIISCNGDYVTFASNDPSIDSIHVSSNDTYYHTYLYDRINGTYELVDQTNNGTASSAASDPQQGSFSPIDDDGNVVFYSTATNLSAAVTNYPWPDPGQVWLRDRADQTTELLSKNSSGTATDFDHIHSPTFNAPSISANGKVFCYSTNANNLVSGDTNNTSDVYTLLTGIE